jgi:hypothetical protein
VARLRGGRPGFDSLQGQRRDFCSLHNRIHTGSGEHPASYKMGTLFPPEVMRPGREADHSLPPIVDVRMSGVTSLLPNMSSGRGILLSTGTSLHLPLPRVSLGMKHENRCFM